MGERRNVGGHTIAVDRLDKVLFAEKGITKGDLIDYYERVAETMLPHMRDRPLTMQRFPNGIGDQGFYQKEAPDYFPEWIRRIMIHVEEDEEDQEQVICDDKATLVYLANQACITPHIWLSRADKLHYPDKLIFDFDPADDQFGPIRWAAKALRNLLDEIGLPAFVMTTGSRGLHVVTPLDRSDNFDRARAFARDVADLLAKRHADRLTTAQRKQKRERRLFVDYLRNSYAQNSVAPYAVRALPGAPVACPLDWEELDESDMYAQRYGIDNIFRRLGQKEDPWADMLEQAQSLDGARAQLEEMQAS